MVACACSPVTWEAEAGGSSEAQGLEAAVSYDHATTLQPELKI